MASAITSFHQCKAQTTIQTIRHVLHRILFRCLVKCAAIIINNPHQITSAFHVVVVEEQKAAHRSDRPVESRRDLLLQSQSQSAVWGLWGSGVLLPVSHTPDSGLLSTVTLLFCPFSFSFSTLFASRHPMVALLQGWLAMLTFPSLRYQSTMHPCPVHATRKKRKTKKLNCHVDAFPLSLSFRVMSLADDVAPSRHLQFLHLSSPSSWYPWPLLLNSVAIIVIVVINVTAILPRE
ncbi:hypothetical protein IWZ00DRAFT_260725 [Phyllosticta capitalensis]